MELKNLLFLLKLLKELDRNNISNWMLLKILGFQTKMSQTLFGNPKGPVELGNPNTSAETKLCLNFILFRLKK